MIEDFQKPSIGEFLLWENFTSAATKSKDIPSNDLRCVQYTKCLGGALNYYKESWDLFERKRDLLIHNVNVIQDLTCNYVRRRLTSHVDKLINNNNGSYRPSAIRKLLDFTSATSRDATLSCFVSFLKLVIACLVCILPWYNSFNKRIIPTVSSAIPPLSTDGIKGQSKLNVFVITHV